MKDALKALIEARENLQIQIMKNPDPARLAALRQFDRLQAQKLRRPKTDKEEARELIRRLEELIGQEASVVSGLEEEMEEPRAKNQRKRIRNRRSQRSAIRSWKKQRTSNPQCEF